MPFWYKITNKIRFLKSYIFYKLAKTMRVNQKIFAKVYF